MTTATISWSVTALDCYPLAQGQQDVVMTVHWTCSGTQIEENKTYSASVYSTCQVEFSGGTYTPYEDLTQEQVLEWIWNSGVDQDVTEAAVQQQIDAQINPTVVTPPLPWSA
jgi:hypothetical protein